MRRPILIIVAAVILAALWLLSRPEGDRAPADSVAVSVAEQTAPKIAGEQPAPQDAGTGQTAASPPAENAPMPQPVPEEPKLAELPTRELKPRPTYAVPEDQPTSPPRPITFNNGGPPASRSAPPSSYVPSVGPGVARPRGNAFGSASQINGPAQPAAGASLTVDGRPVKLFGVRPPDAAERCNRADGQVSCREAAQALLGQRLKANSSVHCRVPLARPGEVPSAICLDSSGVDLGGLLVGEGLALADTSQSYDYFGAEGIARNYRKGLWASR